MKKFFVMLLALPLLFAACSKDDTAAGDVATISFDKKAQSLPEGSVDIKLLVSGLDDTSGQEYVIDLKFSGTAKKDDYELSSDHFVIGGKNPITTITVTSQNTGTTDKNLVIDLVPPKGFSVGDYPSTMITLASLSPLYYYFLEEEMELKEYLSPYIALSTEDGDDFYPETEMRIPAAIDKTASTAVLGTHFEFVGEPAFVQGPDDDFAYIKLKALKYEEGKNTIVLTVDPEATRFAADFAGECTITITGSDYEKIGGTWYVSKQITDKAYMRKKFSQLGLTEADLTGYPEAVTADRFTFDVKNNKLTTSLQSELKNFFGASSTMTPVDSEQVPCTILPANGDFLPEYHPKLIDLDNCNRDFSSASTSADKDAYIGVILTEEGTLQLYLLDYKSKSFCPGWLNGGTYYDSQRPMAAKTVVYLLFELERVQ